MKNSKLTGIVPITALWLLLALLLWFGPRTDISQAERRKLEQFPALNLETVLDGRFMSNFESFSQDQFPLRDTFRQIKALVSTRILRRGDNNGIYLAQGYAAKLEYPLNTASVEGAVTKFQKLYDTWLAGNTGKIVFSVVPDKSYYLAEKNGYPAMDYDALFDAFRHIPWASYSDLSGSLSLSSYYRTDTHWRQEALTGAAQKIADALGVDIADDYHITTMEQPFYGVYCGQAALPMEPDTLCLMESDTLNHCTVTNYETGKTGTVYDLDKLSGRDPYDVFLSGAVSVLTIDNPNAKTDRELIVFRDSFGSSLVPLLVPGYAKITLLDTRYIPAAYLDRFVTFSGQDVLFLYSPLVLNNSAMLR